jgi:hypothetical protein
MKFVVLVVLGIATSVLAQSQWQWEGKGSPDMTRLNAIASAFPQQGRLPNSLINLRPGSFLHELSPDLDIEGRVPFCFRFGEGDVLPPQTELSVLRSPRANRLIHEPDCIRVPLSPKSASDLRPASLTNPVDTILPTSMIRAADSRRAADGSGREEVSWTPLARQSLAYLGIMHSFRLATEPSTRNAMSNPVVGGYFQSLGALHGWSDGDTYYENYLGHPIEGAVSGYLLIHNDPRYRNVEFGRSRDYWMSRLRAYAFAWAFSEQFEIGLLSEASIGQIQRYCCAYGFVDHVITPNGGILWIVGGDIVDKYVTRRMIEDHTRNSAVRAVARGVLNPPLSFANFMAGQYPWHRENRPGVRDYDGELHLRVENRVPLEIRQVPSFELTATLPSVLQFGRLSCVGGGGVGAFRLTDSWQWTAEVSGCTFGNFEKNWSGDSLTFSTGPQWISHTSSRWSLHFGMRLGGQKVTQEYVDPVKKQRVLHSLPPGKSVKDVRDEYTTHFETTGPSLVISGGTDLRLNRALALRAANVDYVRSWLDPINGYDLNQGYRVSTGLVLRMGTW